MSMKLRIAKLEEYQSAPDAIYISEHLDNGNVLVWPMGSDKRKELSRGEFEATYRDSKHRFILHLSEGMWGAL